MFKAESIIINVHDKKNRQILLVDDKTGEQTMLSFKPGRITTSFVENSKERLFDYYGREIQIDDSIAEIIEQTGHFWINCDQECFLVRLKNDMFAIASVNYYYSHSGGHKQKLIEYNSELNPEHWKDGIGQIWLEPTDRIDAIRSYDKDIIKNSCIGYWLDNISEEPEKYWLLNLVDNDVFVYNMFNNTPLYKVIFDDSLLTDVVAHGYASFSGLSFHQDKQSLIGFVRIGEETIKVGTNLEIIKYYLTKTNETLLFRGLPLFCM